MTMPPGVRFDRTSAVGRLDKGIDAAHAQNWTAISMKPDWNRAR
jgi:hypothetical protein